jgi:hypothetical protein
MQRDDEFSLADGRTIRLESVCVSNWFLGYLEGTGAACSADVRRKWREKSELRGWQVVDMHGEILPPFQCVASFKSYRPVRILEWHYSYLDICWFVGSLDISLRNLIVNLLPHVDWEHRALDGSWDDL